MPWHTTQRFTAMLVLLGWTSVADAQKLDLYGDPLPAGAIVRLGTKRLQTKGGFGWTPDGKSLATFRDGTVYFWDLEDGHCRETLLVPIKVDPFFSYGTKFLLSADGQKLICADFHGAIATWNLATVESASVPAADPNKQESNRALALHPDGKQFVTLQQNGELQFRDFATCQVQRTIALKDNGWYEQSDAVFSPDGKVLALAGGRADSIYLLDPSKDAEPQVIKRPHSQYLHGIGFLADGRLYSFGTTKAGPPPAEGAD